ncbi:MAG: rod shape-determining protein MreD [Methylococcaceae bacterium]|nr:rod shape-determining protein MreD [Methylococcaceae bacterium]
MSKSSLTLVIVCVSLAFAMILRILPWPPQWLAANPDWVLLFVVYWNMAIPDRFGVVAAWTTGLFADALTGRMLGQHALAYTLVAFMCLRLHRQLRLSPLFQQGLMILLFHLLCQVLVFWTQNMRASPMAGATYWMPSLMGGLLWPVTFLTLRRLRRSCNIG